VSIGLLETARVEGGRVPLWPLHLQRLVASAAALGLALPARLPGEAEVAHAARGVPGAVAAVRLTLTDAGVGLSARPVDGVGTGWRAAPAPDARSVEAEVAHKTTERAAHEAAARYARAQGCDEALWVNGSGALTEGTITNLFVCTGGRVLTPPLSAGVLPGIARGRLLALRQLAGRRVAEADLRPGDLALAEEVFLTNAVRGAVPLLAWEGAPLRRGDLWLAASGAIFPRQ